MASCFNKLERKPEWHAAADPTDRRLGSGGSTAHLLATAWRASGGGRTFHDWLGESRKLVIHGGGQSRRLPAYSTVGKPLLPMPVLRWSRGQRLDQTLLDLQLPAWQRLLEASHHPVLVASGDVLVRFGRDLPQLPKVDVLATGVWMPPETASAFGIFCLPRSHPTQLDFVLQKPTAARLRELSTDYLCLADAGMWLLSARAVDVLLAKCGWRPGPASFPEDTPGTLDFYGEFGRALGAHPIHADPEIAGLTSAAIPLPDPEFYHFGTNIDLIQSTSRLQNRVADESRLGPGGGRGHPDQHILNSQLGFALRQEANHTLWIENSVIPSTWSLTHSHILTGVPDNRWTLHLDPGICLDIVPIGNEELCIRPYGITDNFRGAIGSPETTWMGRPAPSWFADRQLDAAAAGIDPDQDIQTCPLFPVFSASQLSGEFVHWMIQSQPPIPSPWTQVWAHAERLSADSLNQRANLDRLYAQRAARRPACLNPPLTIRQAEV
jgi:hypothetical protein